MSDHAIAETWRNNELVGFTESSIDGRAGFADTTNGGAFRYGAMGDGPKGEEDTLDAAHRLIAAWNRPERRFDDPRPGEADVDAWTVDLVTRKRFEIQVVRGVDNGFWHSMAKDGKVQREEDGLVLARQLFAAIESKSKRIPPARRPRLILAVNALLTPLLCFDSVMQTFAENHGVWLKALGFLEVWIVGRTTNLVRRLDVP